MYSVLENLHPLKHAIYLKSSFGGLLIIKIAILILWGEWGQDRKPAFQLRDSLSFTRNESGEVSDMKATPRL